LKNTSSRAAGPLLSLIAAAALLVVHPGVSALSLGRLNVQSTLGEPLRAEIDIASLSAEEATSLRASLASPEAFRAAGVDYNPVLAGAKATLAKRADGRAYVRLTGERAVTEPFVDVILDFSWSSGRLQRSYTLLIDPPLRPAPVVSSTAPVMAPAPAMPRPVAAAPAVSPTPITAPAPVQPAPAPVPAPRPRPVAKAPAPAVSDSVTVRSGDTLSSIALAHGHDGVSLDQMLVSLYRGNPNAFMDNNMNRLKAGVVLDLPSQSTAQAISGAEARQVIQAQSADFNAFRRNLAGAAQKVPSTEPSRQATGKVEAAVTDRKADAAAASADQLKLARGIAAAQESKISKEAERKAADQRVAELARNVEELKRLSGGAKTAPAAAAAPVPAAVAAKASVPSVTVPVAAPVVVAAASPVAAPMPAASPAQPASVAAEMATEVASAPVVVAAASQAASRPAAPPAPAPAPSESFFDQLSGNPFVLPGAVGLVALLAGLGVMRLRRRGSESPGETSFIESKLTPDSFFGVSGGQRVDTRDGAGNSSSSSLSYSLSQLDAIGDVDPVAEADVYLAYGRDLQAEEILKEALRAEPDRIPVRAKLLEVYAKRADTRTFEAQARQLQDLTNGEGDDWARVQELGRQIDPANTLYGAAGITSVDIDTSSDAPPDLQPGPDDWQPPAAVAQTEKTQPFEPLSTRDEDEFDVDIDLEAASSLTGLEQTRPLVSSSVMNDLDDSPAATPPEPLVASLADSLPPLDLDTPPVQIDLDALDEPQAPTPQPPVTGPGDFDFGDLSLDLDPPAPPVADADTPPETVRSGFGPTDAMPDFGQDDLDMDDGDPLARKVELADEFRRIGDVEGARDLLEEVVSKAEGGLQQRAQAMLDELS
jgi:pilus assembly protein FimV